MSTEHYYDESIGTHRHLRTCDTCGKWIDPNYGADEPAAHTDTTGTRDDPHAPADTDNECAPCAWGDH